VPTEAARNPFGDDLLLSDVISFDVKVLQEGYNPTEGGEGSVFMDLPPSSELRNNSPNFANVSVFDTWSRNGTTYGPTAWDTPVSDVSVPLRLRILALQITIRVWDEKTEQARQVTIIQDM
jgi:hypothetical protein